MPTVCSESRLTLFPNEWPHAEALSKQSTVNMPRVVVRLFCLTTFRIIIRAVEQVREVDRDVDRTQRVTVDASPG